MRQAALIFTILLGAFWAGPSPVAAQAPPGPPPHVELPKDKKPKPEKPEVPKGPKVPSAPEPPEPEPPPSPEPAPPVGEEPPSTDEGGTGTGGDATNGGSGAEPRGVERGGARDESLSAVPRTAAARGDAGESQASGRFSRAFRSIAPSPVMELASRVSLDSFEASRTSAAPDGPYGPSAADDGRLGVGGLPLAVLALGLILVAIGLAAGVARVRGGGAWHPPGSRPERT
jgi:hypothetical protein